MSKDEPAVSMENWPLLVGVCSNHIDLAAFEVAWAGSPFSAVALVLRLAMVPVAVVIDVGVAKASLR
ncbi:unannotated protein [freshwater metagenome]|uniref:Unannotated protein n=1 Tax=freshwater metagenome TaxID=449393 RepID=A0A6J6EW22_9ZZZZ